MPVLNLPTPLEKYCVIENGKMCPKLMLSFSVLDAIIKLARFKCKNERKTILCFCKRAHLVCTDSSCCNDHEEYDNISYCKVSEIGDEDGT